MEYDVIKPPLIKYIVIMLHGLHNENFLLNSTLDFLNTRQMNLTQTLWIFPKAKTGVWFDDEISFEKAKEDIFDFVNQIIRLYKSIPVFLGGFSQGATLALYTFLQYDLNIKGLLLISPFNSDDKTTKKRHKILSDIPTLIIHGINDKIIPIEHSIEINKMMPNSILIKTEYGHEIKKEMIGLIQKFVNDVQNYI